MSKRRIFPCPGCGLPFTEGRSFSQHLVWNPACKGPSGSRPIPQVGASPSEVDTNIDADVVRTSDCVNDDTNAYPDNLSIDESLNADDGPEKMTASETLFFQDRMQQVTHSTELCGFSTKLARNSSNCTHVTT